MPDGTVISFNTKNKTVGFYLNGKTIVTFHGDNKMFIPRICDNQPETIYLEVAELIAQTHGHSTVKELELMYPDLHKFIVIS